MNACFALFLAAVILLLHGESCEGMRPTFSWDTLGNMTFFHGCNESGLFSDAAMETISKFPFVTIEKGQGFDDGSPHCTADGGQCAEDKILAQIRAVKARNPRAATILYMNSVLVSKVCDC